MLFIWTNGWGNPVRVSHKHGSGWWTNTIEQSHSSEADSRSDGHEIYKIPLWQAQCDSLMNSLCTTIDACLFQNNKKKV